MFDFKSIKGYDKYLAYWEPVKCLKDWSDVIKFMSMAAIFWIRCKGFKEEAGKPAEL